MLSILQKQIIALNLWEMGIWMIVFFLYEFYSFKIVYKENIIHPLLEELSGFEILLIQATRLHNQFCFSEVRPGHRVREAGDGFPHGPPYPKCRPGVHLCPLCLPSPGACFKIHLRIELPPVFAKPASKHSGSANNLQSPNNCRLGKPPDCSCCGSNCFQNKHT